MTAAPGRRGASPGASARRRGSVGSRRRRRPPPASRAATRSLAKAERGPPQWRRDAGAKGDRRDRARRGGEAARQEQAAAAAGRAAQAADVNLDSPFAKLLALKPLLRGRDKNQ